MGHAITHAGGPGGMVASDTGARPSITLTPTQQLDRVLTHNGVGERQIVSTTRQHSPDRHTPRIPVRRIEFWN